MSAAEQIRARAQRIQSRDHTVDPVPVHDPPPARTTRVRQTFDLQPDRHAALAAWKHDTALQLERTRLTMQDVLVAAIETMLADPQMARRVRDRLGQP